MKYELKSHPFTVVKTENDKLIWSLDFENRKIDSPEGLTLSEIVQDMEFDKDLKVMKLMDILKCVCFRKQGYKTISDIFKYNHYYEIANKCAELYPSHPELYNVDLMSLCCGNILDVEISEKAYLNNNLLDFLYAYPGLSHRLCEITDKGTKVDNLLFDLLSNVCVISMKNKKEAIKQFNAFVKLPHEVLELYRKNNYKIMYYLKSRVLWSMDILPLPTGTVSEKELKRSEDLADKLVYMNN